MTTGVAPNFVIQRLVFGKSIRDCGRVGCSGAFSPPPEWFGFPLTLTILLMPNTPRLKVLVYLGPTVGLLLAC